eukprot:2317111-Rhodomonas_salina.1
MSHCSWRALCLSCFLVILTTASVFIMMNLRMLSTRAENDRNVRISTPAAVPSSAPTCPRPRDVSAWLFLSRQREKVVCCGEGKRAADGPTPVCVSAVISDLWEREDGLSLSAHQLVQGIALPGIRLQ